MVPYVCPVKSYPALIITRAYECERMDRLGAMGFGGSLGLCPPGAKKAGPVKSRPLGAVEAGRNRPPLTQAGSPGLVAPCECGRGSFG